MSFLAFCTVVFGERSFSVFRPFSDSFWSNSPTVCLFLYPFLSHVFSKACVSSRSWRMRTTNNSLSTMSSPVPASSRSSSGSTPVPTVATPASPPSQPVSLPENNALAQAISRALAESLPPLLCALRDSSGGNTNTATTAGPLSSASTSSPRLRHPPAPVLSALPLSLQVRLLCPHLFQPTAHMSVLRLSPLFPPHPPPSCL